MGGGGAPGAAQAGLPFGGIPHELQAGVDLLLEEEPDRGESDAIFTQLPSPHESKKLSLTTLLMEYPLACCALAVVLVGIIALFTQARARASSPTPSTDGHDATATTTSRVVVAMARALPGLHRRLGRRPVGPGPGDGPARRRG